MNGPERHTADHLVKGWSFREENGQNRQQRHPENHLKADVYRGQHAQNGERLLAAFAVFKVHPAVQNGRQIACHGHHGNHTNYRNQTQRAQRRMLGKSQHPNAYEHDERAKHHGIAVGMQNLLAGLILVLQPFGNEDAVIVSHTEDEGSQNNIDNVELQAREAHNSPYPNPANSQRQEGNEREFQRAKAKPEENEHNKRTHQADGIEILRKGAHQGAGGILLRGKVYRLEIFPLLRLPILLQGVEERLEAMGRKAGLQALLNKGIGNILMPCPEGFPQADALLLLLIGGKREGIGRRRQGFQEGEAIGLLPSHIVDVVQIGVELKLLSGEEEQHRKGQEGQENGAAAVV